MKTMRQLASIPDLAALVFGNLIWAATAYRFPMVAQPAWLLAALVFIGCITGFYIGATAAFSGVEPRKAVRDGVWAAGIAATVSMACFVLTFYGGSNPFIAIKALVGGALSVLPAAFYGMFSAALAVLVMSRPSSVTTAPRSDFGMVECVTRWSARVAVIALVAFAIWTPFHPVIVATERTLPSQPRIEAQPAAPDFKYSAPDQIAIAEAMQWKLVAHRTFAGIASSPIAFSHDQRWLAVSPVGGQTIRILDLNSSATKPDFMPPSALSRFAFAPDGNRLFTLSNDALPKVGIIDIDTAGFVALPKPKGRELPQGGLSWHRPKASP